MEEVKLPQWQCHKKVFAAKIGAIGASLQPGMAKLELLMPAELEAVYFGPAWVVIEVSQAWIERFKPEVGGYYVRYEDGYASFSPAKAFEDGYALIQRDDAGPYVRRKLTVSQIERLMQHGVSFRLEPDGLVKIPVDE